jgi:hypothetical protein
VADCLQGNPWPLFMEVTMFKVEPAPETQDDHHRT